MRLLNKYYMFFRGNCKNKMDFLGGEINTIFWKTSLSLINLSENLYFLSRGRKGKSLSTLRRVWCLKSFSGFKHLFPNSQQPLIRAFNKTERRENLRVGMRRHVYPTKTTTFLHKTQLPRMEGRRRIRRRRVRGLTCQVFSVWFWGAGRGKGLFAVLEVLKAQALCIAASNWVILLAICDVCSLCYITFLHSHCFPKL